MAPLDYDVFDPASFGGSVPHRRSPAECKVVVLPVPLERTTSYVPGTRNAPRAILEASTQIELWDEEVGVDVHGVGIHTLPQMELPYETVQEAQAEIERVAQDLLGRGKYLVTLGGEHSITTPIVRAAARLHSSLSVLQLDAHADLRESYLGSKFSHACAMRRILDTFDGNRLTQVGVRNIAEEEVATSARVGTHLFYDVNMRERKNWMDEIIDTLSDPVYITFDCDSLDPAIMPAVGTPVPGGLTWRETIRLLRLTFERRNVVACDIVELCPMPGAVASDFLCAKLAYKLMTYKFGLGSRRTD